MRALLAATAAALLLARPALALTSAEQDALARELALSERRSAQLSLHQGFGLATLGALGTTAVLGYSSSHGWVPRPVHVGAALTTTVLYLGTAALALSAPPPAPLPPGLQAAESPLGAWDSSAVHRGLAWVHGATMIATVGLGLATLSGVGQAFPYHGPAAYTTLGALALSAGVITLGF